MVIASRPPLLQAAPAAEPAVALVSHDTVFHCPYCKSMLLRTTNDQFDARGVRCPHRGCRRVVRLRTADTQRFASMPGRQYFCKVRSCRTTLFETSTLIGRVWISCPNPECRHYTTPQIIYLGDPSGNSGRAGQGPPARIVGRARVVIGAPRVR